MTRVGSLATVVTTITLALSECELRRHPLPTTQTTIVSGADSVRFSLPATGQRTKASPNLPPQAATFTSITLSSQKSEWDRDEKDLLLKSANRTEYTESSGINIRAFVEDAENFLEMCGRSPDRWARFIISWLGPKKAEKVRRSHFVADYVDYCKCRECLLTLFGRLDFEDL